MPRARSRPTQGCKTPVSTPPCDMAFHRPSPPALFCRVGREGPPPRHDLARPHNSGTTLPPVPSTARLKASRHSKRRLSLPSSGGAWPRRLSKGETGSLPQNNRRPGRRRNLRGGGREEMGQRLQSGCRTAVDGAALTRTKILSNSPPPYHHMLTRSAALEKRP